MSDGPTHGSGIMFGNRIPTLWMDYVTGQGVSSDGARVTPKIGPRRKNPNLTDMLDTAHSYGAKRIMLSGRVPSLKEDVSAWLLVQTPGWKATGHRVREYAVARFENILTGHRVEVRSVAEWFGGTQLSPADARQAWDVTESIVQSINPKQHLLYSPSRTGLSLWHASLPRNKERKLIVPPHVSTDIAEELHFTSGQGHVEHLVAGPHFDSHPDHLPLIDPKKTPKISTFTYIDGRFMYAAMGRELGVGPGRRLNRAAANEFLLNNPYGRAWYEVRFTVPKDWNHIGILGVKHEDASNGWFYPNRPGARHVTWADAAEIAVAQSAGWLVEPLQAIVFDKDRPMDNFMKAINRAREKMEANEELPRPLRHVVGGALRMLLIQTVGALAGRGGTKTMIVDGLADVPPHVSNHVRHGKVWVYEQASDKRDLSNYHPEISIQVWGRARARLLRSPAADGVTGGVLALPGGSVIGVQGDAVYTTQTPSWSIPVAHGGAEDGNTGRLRIKGTISGSISTPVTIQDRDRLKARTEKAGPSAAWQQEQA